MTVDSPLKLRLPAQELTEFSVFPLRVDEAESWAEALPVANVPRTLELLATALEEFNRVEMAPGLRHDILEKLAPAVDFALSGTLDQLVKQPLTLPPSAKKTAEDAEALSSLFHAGYTLTAVEAIRQRKTITGVNPARLVCGALQRALYFNGLGILVACVLHRPAASMNWLQLNQLYLLAERQQLTGVALPDLSGRKTTIAQTYLRALLLGCSKTNQLRKADILELHRSLADWSRLGEIHTEDNGSCLFAVDLSRNQPPEYAALYTDLPNAINRYIDTSRVVSHLRSLQDERRSKADGEEARVNAPRPEVLERLIHTLGTIRTRNFSRSPARGELKLAVGLSSVHFHVAGKQHLEQVMGSYDPASAVTRAPGYNPFMQAPGGKDVWAEANPHEFYDVSETEWESMHVAEPPVEAPSEPEEPLTRFPVYGAEMVNASPGGYCLAWSEALPPEIRVGEIVAVHDEDSEQWLIGVIRWVSRLRQEDTLIGIELLSPRAIAYGVKPLQHKASKAEPARALMLPEIKLVAQPNSLITSNTGFHENQKLVLIRNEDEVHIKLLQKLNATASFSQYGFTYIKGLEELLSEDPDTFEAPGFDSVWNRF